MKRQKKSIVYFGKGNFYEYREIRMKFEDKTDFERLECKTKNL